MITEATEEIMNILISIHKNLNLEMELSKEALTMLHNMFCNLIATIFFFLNQKFIYSHQLYDNLEAVIDDLLPFRLIRDIHRYDLNKENKELRSILFQMIDSIGTKYEIEMTNKKESIEYLEDIFMYIFIKIIKDAAEKSYRRSTRESVLAKATIEGKKKEIITLDIKDIVYFSYNNLFGELFSKIEFHLKIAKLNVRAGPIKA